jgi:ubiquinone/menaquinone biosynthesis C-methylase UbiE
MAVGLLNEVSARQAAHFDGEWKGIGVKQIQEALKIPGLPDLTGKRVLVCSCGSGIEPVMAARAGAEVYAVDISSVGVANAQSMARFNQVRVEAEVMDLHQLRYTDDFFDVIYGSAILHHLDCSIFGAEMMRCLKPGGIGYFFDENSDSNRILNYFYNALSKTDRSGKFKKVGFLQRLGTADERILSRDDLRILSAQFSGNLRILVERFGFFQLFSRVIRGRFLGITTPLDNAIFAVAPFLRRYSYYQDVWMQKPPSAEFGKEK